MKERDKKFMEYWAKKRTQGIVKFSLTTGITYALFVIIFSKVFAWNWTFTPKDLSYGVLSVLIGITVLGPFMWWHRDKKYKKLLAEQNEAKKLKKKRKKR